MPASANHGTIRNPSFAETASVAPQARSSQPRRPAGLSCPVESSTGAARAPRSERPSTTSLLPRSARAQPAAVMTAMAAKASAKGRSAYSAAAAKMEKKRRATPAPWTTFTQTTRARGRRSSPPAMAPAPARTPSATRRIGGIQSLSTAYLKKVAAPSSTTSAPARVSHTSAMRSSSVPGGAACAGTGGATEGATAGVDTSLSAPAGAPS
ncbi:MAG: hypothetical protein QM704_27590 [Anaeromyxobacteraceae bacterium]